MSDTQLTQLLANLADAIREIPKGREHSALAQRFFEVIAHLESKGAVDRGNWNLGSRR